MKRFRYIAMVAVAAVLCTSCATNMIDASKVAPLVRKVTDRHDKMLNGELDPSTIDPLDKQSYLRSSTLLNRLLDEATQSQPETPPGT